MLDELTQWNLEIRFVQETASSGYKAILGSMYSDSDTDDRGWGIWVTPAQIIHWSGDSSTYNFEEFTVEVGTNYKLNIIRDGDNFSFIFNNLDSGNRLVDNLNYSDYIMATKHTVVTGGEWENRSDEIFPGHISNCSINWVHKPFFFFSFK